jgi:hypothetical protein
MRKLFIFLFVTCCAKLLFAQDLPTIPANGFAFPLGTRFSIKLYPVDSVNFDYSIIAFESYTKIVDWFETEKLFDETGPDSTITFCFCLGTSGKKKKEKKENMRVLLLMKNYSKWTLSYTSDIQREENGEFLPTSNVGTFSGAQGTEIWPYMIYMIGLKDFRIFSEMPSDIIFESNEEKNEPKE